LKDVLICGVSLLTGSLNIGPMASESRFTTTIATILLVLRAVAALTVNCSAGYNATSPFVVRSNEDYIFADCSQPVFIEALSNIANVSLHLRNTALAESLQLQAPLVNVSIEFVGVIFTLQTPFTLITTAVSATSSNFSSVSVTVMNDVIVYSAASPWPSLLSFRDGLTCIQCVIVLNNLTVLQGNQYFLDLQSEFTDQSHIWILALRWTSASRVANLNPSIVVRQLTNESVLVVDDALLIGTIDVWLSMTEVTGGSRITLSNTTTREFSSVLLNLVGTMTNAFVLVSNVTDDRSFQVLLVMNSVVSDASVFVRGCTFTASNNAPILFQSVVTMTNVYVSMQQLRCIDSICLNINNNLDVVNASLSMRDITSSGSKRLVDWFYNTWSGLTIVAHNIQTLSCAGVSWLRCVGSGINARIELANSTVAALGFVTTSIMSNAELFVVNATWCPTSGGAEWGIAFAMTTTAARPALYSNVFVRLQDCAFQQSSLAVLAVVADIVRNVTLQLVRVDASASLPLDNNSNATGIVGVTVSGESRNASYGVALAIVDSVMGGSASILNVYPIMLSVVHSVIYCGPTQAFRLYYNSSNIAPLDMNGSIVSPSSTTLPPVQWDSSVRFAFLWFQETTLLAGQSGGLILFDADVALSTVQWNVSVVCGNGTMSFGEAQYAVTFLVVSLFSLQLFGIPGSTITSNLRFFSIIGLANVTFFLGEDSASSLSPSVVLDVRLSNITSAAWIVATALRFQAAAIPIDPDNLVPMKVKARSQDSIIAGGFLIFTEGSSPVRGSVKDRREWRSCV
jgi:hypothetical protein